MAGRWLLGSTSTSLLHLCPTNSTGCNGTRFNGTPFTGHPGGLRFNSGSVEDNLISQWISDGALY